MLSATKSLHSAGKSLLSAENSLLSASQNLPAQVYEMVLGAAVREVFRPTSLLGELVTRHGELTDDTVSAAMEASLTLSSLAQQSVAEKNSAVEYELPLDLRRKILAQSEPGAIIQALDTIDTPTLTEKSLRSVVSGANARIEEKDRTELLALAEASSWTSEMVGLPHLSPEIINRRLIGREFTERVGGHDLSLFVGRKALLNALDQLWQLEVRPTVLIEGPGGIGKSIAVAQFFKTLLECGVEAQRPDAIYYFDFDLASLQRAHITTMVSEMISQTAQRWAPENARELHHLRQSIRGFVGEALESISSIARSSLSQINYVDVLHDMLKKAFPERHRSKGTPLRMILFADSYERVETLDDRTSDSIERIAAVIRDVGVDLMTIYAARTYIDPQSLDPAARPSRQSVRAFTQSEANSYLIEKANSMGIILTVKQASRANRHTKGWPLALRIAISLLSQSGPELDIEAWIASLDGDRRPMSAALYDRFLRRIRDDDLKKLAMPGLIVRRITSEVIREVLAGPCKIDLTQISAERLMTLVEQEGQLFHFDNRDPGALWHRADLRELMLPSLLRETNTELVRSIHDNAVRYYKAKGEDRIVRAEELYHRLWRGDSEDTIAHRWTEEAGDRLTMAVLELPRRAASILRRRLGGGRIEPEASADPLNRENRLRELRQVAQKYLMEGDTDLFSIFDSAGVPYSMISPLGDIAAQAMQLEARYEEIIYQARALSQNPRIVAKPIRGRIYMTAAAVAEGLNELEQAREFWMLGRRYSAALEPVEQLSILVGQSRMMRKLGARNSTRSRKLRDAAAMLRENIKGVAKQRVAKLEALAELSELLLPRHAHWRAGEGAFVSELLNQLLRMTRPLFASMVHGSERGAVLAEILDLPENESSFERAIKSFISGKEISLEAGNHAVAALHNEVDFGLAIAVGRDSDGRRGDPASRALRLLAE